MFSWIASGNNAILYGTSEATSPDERRDARHTNVSLMFIHVVSSLVQGFFWGASMPVSNLPHFTQQDSLDHQMRT